MALFVLADLHLSLGSDKPMDVFPGWERYVEKLERNWRSLVKETDTVVVAGDISWAMKLEDTYQDFAFLHGLPGTKLLLKGNHDYWWSTKSKIETYFAQNGFDTLHILHNDAYLAEGKAICGTRGWLYNSETEEDQKIVRREVGRLQASLDEAKRKDPQAEQLVFLHYPPVYGNMACKGTSRCWRKRKSRRVTLGTSTEIKLPAEPSGAIIKGIKMHLISCDYVNFIPVFIR